MTKKVSAIILTIAVLLGLCACSVQKREASSIESNLKQINKGIEQFSELKNGTLEVVSSFKVKNNAVNSLNTNNIENASLVTFVLNRKGYDFIKETYSENKKTGGTQYSAIKQVHGSLFYNLPVKPSANERVNPYEWEDIDRTSGIYYEPNDTLKMMLVPAQFLSNEKYVATVTKEKNGSLVKYTVSTNDEYSKDMREIAHSAEENYIVHERSDIYWVNKYGLLIMHKSYEEFEWTINGISDTYVSDITVELTGYNYNKLTEIGGELSSMIMFEGEIYTQSLALPVANLDALIEIGTINSVVGSVQEPEKNNQANRSIKNAIVYRSGENSVIVKYKDYLLYEKNLKIE